MPWRVRSSSCCEGSGVRRVRRVVGEAMEGLPVVLDNGTYEVRVGYGGDETPRYVAPNCTARPRQQLRVLVGDEIYSIKNLAQLEVTRPLERGILVNAGCQREVWARCFDSVMCEPRDSRVVVTEAVLAPPSAQRAMDEILFEDFSFLGRCRASSPACAATAAARLHRESCSAAASGDATRNGVGAKGGAKAPKGFEEVCLVVDVGHSATTATPVVEGSPVRPAIRRSDIGGQCVTGYVRELVTFRQMNMNDETMTLDKMKKALCFVSTDFDDDLGKCDGTTKERGTAGPHYAEFVLPDFHKIDEGYARLDAHAPPDEDEPLDGKPVRRRRTRGDATPQFLRLESERFCAPELLFSPQDVGLRQCGVHELIADSIVSTHPYLRAPLAERVILCGGSSNLPGLKDRLMKELRPLVSAASDLEIIHPPDAHLLPFQGAAILAQDPANFVSRLDYLEHGPDRYQGGWAPRPDGL